MLLAKRKKTSTEIPTSALPDIVFLLLIFFLVTTTIDAEKGLDLVLPPAQSELLKMAPENIANLLINAAGNVAIDNQIVEIRDITRIIKERLQANPILVVSVKTDKLTKYDVYLDVIDKLKKAEAKRISLAEPEEN
ncbi:MAG: biopolymer transporter ExbD [Calditrichia bacterium]|jgi:biopolymer transport protein ExbD|nr:biopolymer transporter ExbD [Calditrichia bacterium]